MIELSKVFYQVLLEITMKVGKTINLGTVTFLIIGREGPRSFILRRIR